MTSRKTRSPGGPRSRRRNGRGSGPPVRVRHRVVRVDPKAARRLAGGHPWVFRDSISRSVSRLAGGRSGDLLDVLGPSGEPLGRGYFVAEGAIAIRILSGRSGEADPAKARLQDFQSALELRRRMLPSDLTAYRVIHGDGDGFSGVNVDRFGPHAVIYQLCPEARFLADELKEWVGEALGLSGVYVQERFAPPSRNRAGDPARLVWGRPADLEQTASESGLRFLADVTAPGNPGLYPDQRPGRSLVGSLAEDLDVLNCFSYTGGFTVYAVAARAQKVVSVDLSNRCHTWAVKNLQLNGLDASRHEFLASEAISALTRMARKGKHRFQLAIVDPPTFSVSKKGAMSLTRDYPELMSAVLEVLAPSGMVLASCNAAKMSEKDFLKLLAAASNRTGRRLNVIQRLSLPCDFPVPAGFTEGHYLKTVLLKVD